MRTPRSKPLACVAGALLFSLVAAPSWAAAGADLRLHGGEALSFDGGSAIAGPLLGAAPRRAAAGFAEREGSFKLGGSFGMLLASGFTGLALRFQGAYAVSEFDPRVFFDFAGHAGVAIGSNSQIFEFVPIARLRFLARERLGIYGDTGFGISIGHTTGTTDLGAILRFSGGVQYAISPTMTLAFEPLGLNVYIGGGGSSFAYSMLLGLLFKV